LAGRKWGPEVAGWLSAFPIVSGPILLTISLEQGAAFAAAAAEGTLLAVIAILVFSVAYAWASIRNGVAGSMILALLAYLLAVAGVVFLN
jgi:lipoprotein signal peptidase